MRLWVNGRDRTADIGESVSKSAVVREKRGPAPARISSDISAMMLLDARSEEEYRAEFLRLLRYRNGLDTFDFHIPRKPGPAGALAARFKGVLWRLLRYQHDRISFRQNLINCFFTGLFEIEIGQRDREIEDLRRRLGRIEARLQPAGGRS